MRNEIQHTVALLGLMILLALPQGMQAQRYAPNDTTHVYTTHGTIYANKFVGRRTSSGMVFRHSGFTAAHWRIKLGTYVLVTNPKNGKQVVVLVNDRCPNRGVIDLTRNAARAIGIEGCEHVTVQQLPKRYALFWKHQGEIEKSRPTWIPSHLKPHLPQKKNKCLATYSKSIDANSFNVFFQEKIVRINISFYLCKSNHWTFSSKKRHRDLIITH